MQEILTTFLQISCIKRRLINILTLLWFKLTKSSLKRHQTWLTYDYWLLNYFIFNSRSLRRRNVAKFHHIYTTFINKRGVNCFFLNFWRFSWISQSKVLRNAIKCDNNKLFKNNLIKKHFTPLLNDSSVIIMIKCRFEQNICKNVVKISCMRPWKSAVWQVGNGELRMSWYVLVGHRITRGKKRLCDVIGLW